MEYQLIESNLTYNKELSAIETVLINRGIYLEDIEHYLNTTDDDIFPATLFPNVADGAKMLIKHIAAGDKIFVQVDADCDGFTSSALLINYLNCLFPGIVQNNLYYRLHTGKQHGIILDTIPKEVKLVIVPDAGSNDYEEHKILSDNGIDVLVLDHHQADFISQDACIINNQLCDYPNKNLSGVGVVYKFCNYLDSLCDTDYSLQFLDLVALGLIADMVDLRDYETKHLITKGLSKIRNPFFKAMVEKQSYSLKDEITPIGVAFYIAPYVNAMVRMGTQEEKQILFESMLDYRAYELIPSTKRGCSGQKELRVEQACRNCTNVKNRQTKARDSVLENIEKIIKDKNLLNNKILVIKLDSFAADRNLTGLIANQLMAKYQRPVLLLNKIINPETKEVSWEGSGRGYDKSKFNNLREFLKESGLVMYADGHENALGLGISDNNFNNFIDYSNKQLAGLDFTPCYKVDFIFNGSNFRDQDIIEIANLKSLWGQGISEPFIAIENINVSNSNIVLMSPDKNPTLKINLSNGTSLIKFKSSQEEYEKLHSELGCITINIVGKCEQNIWNGNISAQIIIEDYEIVGAQKYYF